MREIIEIANDTLDGIEQERQNLVARAMSMNDSLKIDRIYRNSWRGIRINLFATAKYTNQRLA